ncbi:histone-binding protein N1/N2-like [Lytechinus pictus]|uniref:histone-binding protein N1/N2-like n=1 Tax=Lytechinus pictus TaxID=7653 RepID=UPI0030B9E9A0
MLGTEEDKPGSSSAAEIEEVEQEDAGPEDVDAEALELMGQGKRNLVVGDPPAAVQCFQEACELLSSKYGETAEECGDAYYQYGCSLLELASMENGVLGNALQGVPDDSADSADSDEEGEGKQSCTGSRVESADQLEAKEREEVIQQVKDALEANIESEESEKEDKEKEGEGEEDEKMEEGGDNKKEEATKEKDKKKEEEGEKKDQEKVVEEKDEKEEKKDEKKEAAKKEKDEKKEEEKKDQEKVVGEKKDDKKDVEMEVEDQDAKKKELKQNKEKKDKEKSDKMETEKKDAEKVDKDDTSMAEKKEDEAKSKTKDDDEDEEAAGPSADGEQKEDGDDISNFQLAWEMLELSRVIISKKEDKESQMKVSQIHLKLGELGLETEQYAQSIVDFNACLEIQKKYLDPESRLIAGTHYNLGLACSFDQKFDESIEHYRKSKQLIEKRLESLEKKVSETEGKGKEKADEKDPIVCDQKEIDELKELLPDIVSKLEDAKEMKLQAVTSDGAGPSSSSGFAAGSSSGFAPSAFAQSSSAQPIQQIAVKKAESVPVTDISHLVRKKRKPEETDAAAAEPKRSRQDENGDKPAVNGSGDSAVVNGNGHMANGDMNGDSKHSPEKPSEIKTKKLVPEGETPAAMETS